MSVQPLQYEEVLARLSHYQEALALLKQYRPYLELLPSVRRLEESLITVPLPSVEVRGGHNSSGEAAPHPAYELVSLPCDLAYLMCDPEWMVRIGEEIFVFIQRPQEDFSQLLGRWRQTQVILSSGYRWQLPSHLKHLSGEGAERAYPLFVLFTQTPEHIKSGLQSAYLPFVILAPDLDSGSPASSAEVTERETQGSC